MEALLQIFAPMIVFVYHCFDRIVINGYLSMLSRPEQHVAYFFRHVVDKPCIAKEVLSERTGQYNRWVESFARNHRIPLQWAEKGVRKEDFTRSCLRAMERKNRFGVYFILKSMEQGTTFRSVQPKYQTDDPHYCILKKTRSRFTHYYFYIRDEKLGPLVIRIASYLPFQTTSYLNGHSFTECELLRRGELFRKNDNAFPSVRDPGALQHAAHRLTPEIIRERLDYWILIVGPKFSPRERSTMNLRRFYAISQIEYCYNVVFRRHFPIQRLFARSCELGILTLTASKVASIFGWRLTRTLHGKLHTALDRIDHAHHTLRAYFKHSFVKQYEKFRTFLRFEVCSNNLSDLRLKKSLENLPSVRDTSQAIINRFATLQAPMLNVHFDFPLLERLALPLTHLNTCIAGIKIHDTRMIRLMEIMLHTGSCLSGLPSAMIHETIVKTYELPHYTINQVRYDFSFTNLAHR